MADSLDLFPIQPTGSTPGSSDPGLDQVEAWFRGQSKMEQRFADALRQSIDEVLDGARTGRFDIYNNATVGKTERTYLGTKVEIVCQAAFELERGKHMDYTVAGHDVDAKFSMSTLFGQAIPREAAGQICLLMHADDRKGKFSVGLVRPSTELLNAGANQDGKKTLNQAGRAATRWLVQAGALPENQLLNLPATTRTAIFNPALGKQERVNELFRRLQGQLVKRNTLITVARQLDGPRRGREARDDLRAQGILILGGQERAHKQIAKDLQMRAPSKGEWISTRVVPRTTDDRRPAALIHGVYYVVATDEEPHVAAPEGY